MEERLQKIEKFIESLKSTNSFPKEVVDTLVYLGFLKFEKSLTYDSGASGNTFENIIVKYKNTSSLLSSGQLPRGFIVKSVSANTCTLLSSDIPDLTILEGVGVVLYTDGTLPGGLDTAIPMNIINATTDTFQFTIDNINPIDITDAGTGNQYITFF